MTIDPSLIGTPGDPSKFDTSGDYLNSVDGTWNEYQTNGKGGWVYLNTVSNGQSAWDQMNNCQSGASPGAGMAGFAQALKLPKNPFGLPDGWGKDNNHQDPNGERWHNDDKGLEFGKGQPGEPGWKGKDHWHVLKPGPNGRWEKVKGGGYRGHYNPGQDVKFGMVALAAYGTWEVVKWGVAVVGAPETFGGSLALAAAVP